MPSEGDMELDSQDGGIVNLTPVFYGNESMGPHLQLVRGDEIVARYRIKVNGKSEKIEMKKAQEPDE
jgi:hypothetical protein